VDKEYTYPQFSSSGGNGNSEAYLNGTEVCSSTARYAIFFAACFLKRCNISTVLQ
jgi:hypothetical protein